MAMLNAPFRKRSFAIPFYLGHKKSTIQWREKADVGIIATILVVTDIEIKESCQHRTKRPSSERSYGIKVQVSRT